MGLDRTEYDKLILRAQQCGLPDVLPALLAFRGDEQHFMVIPDYMLDRRDRSQLEFTLRHALKVIGADSYLWISEAWCSSPDPFRKYPFEGNVDKDPEKREVLVFNARLTDGTKVLTLFEINADRSLGEITSSKYTNSVGGIFAELLDEPTDRVNDGAF